MHHLDPSTGTWWGCFVIFKVKNTLNNLNKQAETENDSNPLMSKRELSPSGRIYSLVCLEVVEQIPIENELIMIPNESS
jgi:hypothetical protein